MWYWVLIDPSQPDDEDTTPPFSQCFINGKIGNGMNSTWYKSQVEIELSAKDYDSCVKKYFLSLMTKKVFRYI